MSAADIVDRLTDAAAPLMEAGNTIIKLRGQVAFMQRERDAARQETAAATRAREAAEQLVAARDAELAELRLQVEAQATDSGDPPDLPKPRKLWGTARDIDGNPAIYTEDQMRQAIKRAHESGRVRGANDVRQRHGITEQPGPRSQEEWDQHAARRSTLRGGGARG
jgi:hypothetical protein